MKNEELDLLDNLRRLASDQPREAGPQIEAKLIAAFRSRHPLRVWRPWLYIAATAALLLLAFLLLPKREPEARFEYVYSAPGFTPLPYAQSGVPLESVVVMRVQMRPDQLSSLGVAVPAAAASAKITADLLVGQDGVPRAVRLVQ
jgi:hypothetical protein